MSDIYISSRTNPTVSMISSLQLKKGRTENGLYICEGLKLCREAVERCRVRFAVIKESCDNSTVRDIANRSGGDIIVLSDGAYDKVSADTSPDGLIFVNEIPKNDADISLDEHLFALECVRDPGNVGTIIRTAAAFGIDRVILADCADVYNPKTVRASMGALFKMKITVCNSISDISEILFSQKRRIISTALTGDSVALGKYSLCPNDCIIVGNEGHGISDNTIKLSDETLIIPMTDKTESLNAASASTVLLWELSKTFETL